MNFFRKNPFAKLIILQLAGIAAVGLVSSLIEIFIGVFLVLLIWRYIVRNQLLNIRAVDSLLTMTALLILISYRTYNLPEAPELKDKNQYVLLQLHNKPIKKENSHQAVANILQSDNKDLIGQKIIIYIALTEEVKDFKAGDKIFGKAFINRIENRGNPYEFDYKNYTGRQNIFFSAYLPANSLTHLPVEDLTPIQQIEQFREKLIVILKLRLDESAYQVASALTLGYRGELSKETQAYFSATGSIHVLSVSGMHVGMLFLLLNVMLGFLKRFHKGRIIYLFSILSILWFYAFLTGLCPPVCRATVMFTFFLIGSELKRPVSNYNSIAVSAFILLFLNPNLLYDVGFQLSYLSMASIFFFYPRFEKLITPSNKVVRAMWQLLCVSMAAQIGVFPLSVYYFHQFPIFFWLSNLLVAPAAYLYLIFSAVILIFNSIEPIALLFSSLLCHTNRITLWLLEKIANLPGALIGFSVSQIQLICLFVVIGFLIAFVISQRYRYLFAVLFFVLSFQATGIIKKISLFNQKKLIVYQHDELLIHLINGRNNYLISNSEQVSEYLYRNVVHRLQLKQPVILNIKEQVDYPDLRIEDGLIYFADKTLITSSRINLNPDFHQFTYGITNLDRITEGTIFIKPD